MPQFANIIVDITHEKLDRTFQYRIPTQLADSVMAGSLVLIPFGRANRLIKGYVIMLTDKAEFDPDKLKDIADVVRDGIPIESHLIRLAAWMRNQYGSTMNQSLKTVLPVKTTVKGKQKKYLRNLLGREELQELIEESKKDKRFQARVRLLEAFLEDQILPYSMITEKLHVSASTIKLMIQKGLMEELTEELYRNPVGSAIGVLEKMKLLPMQQEIVDDYLLKYRQGDRQTCLLHGITGSGKTEIYMEIIEFMIAEKKQVIVLIPEIALTYQTVMRFYKRFGDRVSIINSKLSAGERYDQFLRARRGEIDIMIGPRSALFTPFPALGCIIIDEEHEGSYKSELSPRYDAREVAKARAKMCDASVILGSATPSVDSYYLAGTGEYRLYRLTSRAKVGSGLPEVMVVDLREEMKEGNKSIFSRQLKALILDRLEKKQQIMLFLNRRGYAGFISCRSCGEAMKCPHCDVSLTTHRNGNLVCHYCGYSVKTPDHCPVCGSPYMAAFGIGTQKVEAMAEKEFPGAKILRMDFDTTRKKGGYEKILSQFADGGADILIGTQMIVKGHDFPNVTLVGVLAADLSLFSGDFHASERTFQLLTQAAGRAGRGHLAGAAIIQTYQPEHYSVTAAAAQDYESFYRQEILYRNLLGYPPVYEMLTILVTSKAEAQAALGIRLLHEAISKWYPDNLLMQIGPADAPVSKINDVYRKILHLKHQDREFLVAVKDKIENYIDIDDRLKTIVVQFGFN